MQITCTAVHKCSRILYNDGPAAGPGRGGSNQAAAAADEAARPTMRPGAMQLAAVAALLAAARVHAMDAAAWKQRSIYQVLTDRFALKPGDRDTCDDPGCEPPKGYVRQHGRRASQRRRARGSSAESRLYRCLSLRSDPLLACWPATGVPACSGQLLRRHIRRHRGQAGLHRRHGLRCHLDLAHRRQHRLRLPRLLGAAPVPDRGALRRSRRPAQAGKKTRLFAPFYTKNVHFAETGSGQTQGKHSKTRAFSYRWPHARPRALPSC
jgi:hypothetical protein